jgi:hypothetical protein
MLDLPVLILLILVLVNTMHTTISQILYQVASHSLRS